MATSRPVDDHGRGGGQRAGTSGHHPGGDVEESCAAWARCPTASAADAFVRTAKSVVTPRGQRVAATDKLYLVADLPTLLVAGEHDNVIPVEHTRAAGRLAPGSRLGDLRERSGHFPHLNEPERFADLVAAFVKETKPAKYDRATARRRIVEGPPAPA